MRQLLCVLFIFIFAFAAKTQSTFYTVQQLKEAMEGDRLIAYWTYIHKQGSSNLALKGIRLDSLYIAIDSLIAGGGGGYTDEQAQDAVFNAIIAGTAISVNYDDVGNTFTITNTSPDQTVVLNNGTAISITGTYPNFTITNTSPDQTVVLNAGTGISITGTYPNFTITNTSPDQTVSITNGGGINVTGTYPNFTLTAVDQLITNEGSLTVAAGAANTSIINSNTSGSTGVTLEVGTGLSIAESGNTITLTNTSPDQTVVLNNGTGISVSGTYPNFTITNTSPDQTVVLNAGTGISITGTYPNFTISNTLSSYSNWTFTGSTGPTQTVNSGDNVEFTGSANIAVTAIAGDGLNIDWSASLDDLSDVNLTAPTTGEVIYYDGAEWINAPQSLSAALNQYSIGFGNGLDMLTGDDSLVWRYDYPLHRMGLNWTTPTAELTLKGSPNSVNAGSNILFNGSVFCPGATCYDITSGWVADTDEECFISFTPSSTITFNGFAPLIGVHDVVIFIGGSDIGNTEVVIGSNTYTLSAGINTFSEDLTGLTDIIVNTQADFAGEVCLTYVQIVLELTEVVSDPIFQVIDVDTELPYPAFGLVVNKTNVSLSNTLKLVDGDGNFAYGRGTLTNLTSGSDNVAIGDSSMFSVINNSGNVAYGSNALKNLLSTGFGYSGNVAIGYNALRDFVTGNANTVIGFNAAKTLTGGANLFVGANACGDCGFVGTSTGIGSEALRFFTGGSNNTALGFGALRGTDADNPAGIDNVAIGTSAGYNIDDGQGNLFVGNGSGLNTKDGSLNTYIGTSSGGGCDTCSSNVMLGRNSGFNNTRSNTLWIDNSVTTTPLVGGDFVNNRLGINRPMIVADSLLETLDVGGTFRVSDLSGTATRIGGWSSTNKATRLFIGASLSISGDTLNTLNGGGIYGGSGTVPVDVNAIVTDSIEFTGTDDIGGEAMFNLHAVGNEPEIQQWTGNTGNVLLGQSDVDYYIKSSNVFGFVSDAYAYIQADSIQMSLVENKTVLPAILGITDAGTVKKIEGTNVGDVISWNGTNWAASASGGNASISPANITVDVNDYNPTDLSSTGLAYISSTDIFYITGIVAGAANQIYTFINDGSYPIIFAAQNINSSAANRFQFLSDAILYPDRSISIIYDDVIDRWRIKDYTGDQDIYGRSVYRTLRPGSPNAGDWGEVGFQFSSGTVSSATPTAVIPFAAWQCATGTVSTGSSGIGFNKTIVQAYNTVTYRKHKCLVSTPTLSTALQRYTLNFRETIGYTASASPSNSVGIRYSDNINGGEWECYAKDNAAAETTFDTNIAVTAGQLYDLEIVSNKTNTEFRFFIDGVYITTITTNLPNANPVAASTVIVKSVGTTDTFFHFYNATSVISH